MQNQGMQSSVKYIYTVHCTAPHHNKNRKIHITLCSVKNIAVLFFTQVPALCFQKKFKNTFDTFKKTQS
jgi:hypothetical protein